MNRSPGEWEYCEDHSADPGELVAPTVDAEMENEVRWWLELAADTIHNSQRNTPSCKEAARRIRTLIGAK